MAESKTRGSSKLDKMTHTELMSSISAARESYVIKRWWKYGQPAIDVILATIDVSDPQAVGSVVSGLVNLHGKAVQVGVEVFPYGIVAPEGALLQVKLEPALR
jgi:hypothetical protein